MRDIVDEPDYGGRVSVSLPSLRVDAFTVGTAAQIQKVRRTGLTFAPEGGTWRMRTVINKLITEEDLYGAVDAAFSQGWRRIKLYFLIGLPTERDEDVLGIAELGSRCVEIGRRYNKSITVVASVGGFVPKAHTPFQWYGQDTVAELERKVALLRTEAKRTRGLTIRWHEPSASVAEGLASRGDRRMGAVIERVWRAGGTFQEWSERFDLGLWQEALAAEGLSVEEVCHRDRERRRGPALGPHLGRACTGTSSGATGRTPWPRPRWRTAAGRPATTAAPARTSGSSTWWPRRCRRRAGARARARTWARATASRCASSAVPPDAEPAQDQRRLRLRFAKAGKIRFTSHRDVARLWERALRRSRLPVAYSQGFVPHPLVSFGLALPTGCESLGEYLDIRLGAPSPGETPIAGPARGPERPPARGDGGPGGGPDRRYGGFAPAGGSIV